MPQDTPPDPDAPDALLRARRTRVVVVGGGIAGLVAALEWAKVGAQVTLVEASDRLGGAVETQTLDGLPVDLVVDAFPLADGALGSLIDELRLRERVEAAADLPVWVAGLPAGAAPLPRATVLGIPANPWADDVRRLIGWRGAWRAYLDRLRPPLTIGRAHSLGRLVRSRMGDRVVDRMVAPVTRGLYGLTPDDIDVASAAPGLNAALTRTGSLAGAVGELLPEEHDAPTRGTLRGGLGSLVEAIATRLTDLDAAIRLGVAVTAIRPAPAGTWTIEESAEGDESADAPTEPPQSRAADVVVLATDARAARALLEGADIAADIAESSERDVVTLVVDAPALDSAPRGRAVHPVAAGDPTSVSAVVHATAEWPWLAAVAGPGRHVLRIALPADRDRTDEVAIEAATAQASTLFGTGPLRVRAAARRTVPLPPPASALGHDERVGALRRAASTHPGLAVVGGWVGGTGLARIVSDTTVEIDRQRAGVLWSDDGPTTPAR